MVAQIVSLPRATEGGGYAAALQGKAVSPSMLQPEVQWQLVSAWLEGGHTSVADASGATIAQAASSSGRRDGAIG